MTGRGSDHDPNHYPGSFFGDNNQGEGSSRRQRGQVKDGILNYVDWLMREATDGPSSSRPPPNQRSNPDESNVLNQIDSYMEEAETNILEEVDHHHSDESDQEKKSLLVKLPIQRFPLAAPVSRVQTGCQKSP